MDTKMDTTETRMRVIKLIPNVSCYFSRISYRKNGKTEKIRFTPASRPPARWVGRYYSYEGMVLSVKLCNNRNCPYCQNSLREGQVKTNVEYVVDLELIDSGEWLEEKQATRKYFVAHNLREAEKQKKAEETETKEFYLPSLNLELPEIPMTGLRLVALGSVKRVGASCFAYLNSSQESVIVDCGIDVGGSFEDLELDDMGIDDKIFPNFEWLETFRHRIQGIVVTHGHLDHWGAIPYLPDSVRRKVAVYATPFVAELIKRQCVFLRGRVDIDIRIFKPGEQLKFGNTQVETFLVNHSVPESCGLIIESEGKRVMHLTDFRMADVSEDERKRMIKTLVKIAERPIDVLTLDVVNLFEPGFLPNEEVVFENLEEIIRQAGNQRVFISFFGTNIKRMKAILEIAKKTGKTVKFLGWSISNSYEIGRKLEMVEEAPEEGQNGEIYCVTGCQAEPDSVLFRLSQGEEVEGVSLQSDDIVIISSRPIPGNRKRLEVFREMVLRLGKKVSSVFIDEKGYFEEFKAYQNVKKHLVHISGHASREELLFAVYLLNPKKVLAIHSDFWAVERFKEVMEEFFPGRYIEIPSTLILKVD